MKTILEFIALGALFFFLSGCAVDYTTKTGGKVRFELTGTPEEYLEAGRSFRK